MSFSDGPLHQNALEGMLCDDHGVGVRAWGLRLRVSSQAVAPLAFGGDPKEAVDRLAVYGLKREHLIEHMQCLMLKKQVNENQKPKLCHRYLPQDTKAP